MNVNPEMAMGPDAGMQEGAVERKWFKHVGELANESSSGHLQNCTWGTK